MSYLKTLSGKKRDRKKLLQSLTKASSSLNLCAIGASFSIPLFLLFLFFSNWIVTTFSCWVIKVSLVSLFHNSSRILLLAYLLHTFSSFLTLVSCPFFSSVTITKTKNSRNPIVEQEWK